MTDFSAKHRAPLPERSVTFYNEAISAPARERIVMEARGHCPVRGEIATAGTIRILLSDLAGEQFPVNARIPDKDQLIAFASLFTFIQGLHESQNHRNAERFRPQQGDQRIRSVAFS
jgi:hypothetical protein